MSPKIHIAQGVISSVLLYPFWGLNVIPFGLAIILIDFDHVIQYVVDTHNFSPKGFFKYYEILLKNLDKNYLGLNIFHTLEFYLLVLIIAYWVSPLYYVLFGLLFHHLFDLIFFIRVKKPFIRAYSIIEYIIRRKKHLTSIRQILRQEDSNINGTSDMDIWLNKWGVTSKTVQLNK